MMERASAKLGIAFKVRPFYRYVVRYDIQSL